MSPAEVPDAAQVLGPGPVALPAPGAADDLLGQLAHLDVAREELHVVKEELRIQQEQNETLLARHESYRRRHGHLAWVVPTGLAVTDANGKLLDANPALATELGVPLSWLHDEPLSLYLAPDDVRPFRAALSALVAGRSAEERLSVALRPRQGDHRRVDLFAFMEAPAPGDTDVRVQWVLTPRSAEAGQAAAAIGDDRSSSFVGLAAAFAELTALPVEEPDRQRLLGRMATLVQSAVPGADWVSITLGSPLAPQRLGTDSAEAQVFDGWQLRAQEGPCLDAHATGTVVVASDVTADDRWPALGRLAAGGAVRSVLALPVRDGSAGEGVLNLYSGRPGGFDSANQRIGELAAAAVVGVLQNVTEREALRSLAANLEKALSSRALIDQAKGVLMARAGIDADEAFARLVALSSRLNVKVRDLARLVVDGDNEVVRAVS